MHDIPPDSGGGDLITAEQGFDFGDGCVGSGVAVGGDEASGKMPHIGGMIGGGMIVGGMMGVHGA